MGIDEVGADATIVCTRSPEVFEKISAYLKVLRLSVVKVDDGLRILQRYVEYSPALIIIDNEVPKISIDELLSHIVRANASSNKVTRLVVICKDSSKDTIGKIMKPVKASKGSIKPGFLITPWNVLEFYRQLINHFPGNKKLKSRVDDELVRIRGHEIETLTETQLFLSVSEIGQGLRIELGNDRLISAASDSADDYALKIEKALLSCSAEYIQFSLEATTAMIPANVIAMMMLMNGFASKHKKQILFVAIPSQVKSYIEKYGLEEILPLENEVDLF